MLEQFPHTRLSLLYYFHQKILKQQKPAFFKKCNPSLSSSRRKPGLCISRLKEACLHNIYMNRASLDRESLDRVSLNITTLKYLSGLFKVCFQKKLPKIKKFILRIFVISLPFILVFRNSVFQ